MFPSPATSFWSSKAGLMGPRLPASASPSCSAVQVGVHVQPATVIQVEQLVLAAPLDARDARPTERAAHPRAHPAAERRMEKLQPSNLAPLRPASQFVDRRLNFGQLGHAFSLRALTSFARRTQTAPMHTPTQSDATLPDV